MISLRNRMSNAECFGCLPFFAENLSQIIKRYRVPFSQWHKLSLTMWNSIAMLHEIVIEFRIFACITFRNAIQNDGRLEAIKGASEWPFVERIH